MEILVPVVIVISGLPALAIFNYIATFKNGGREGGGKRESRAMNASFSIPASPPMVL